MHNMKNILKLLLKPFFFFKNRGGDFNIESDLPKNQKPKNQKPTNNKLDYLNLDRFQIQKKLKTAKQVFQKAWIVVYKKRVLILIAIAAFLTADFFKLKAYHFVLPDKTLSVSANPFPTATAINQNKYSSIWENNIFHQGAIPIQLTENSGDPMKKKPVESLLSLKLHGTIVHSNPKKSVATVKNIEGEMNPYQVDEVISAQARILEIQKGKILFFNQNNNRVEFITLPENEKLTIRYRDNVPSKKVSKATKNLVNRKGNRFEVSRSDINSHLDNIYEVLQQALMVPYRENGEITGYKFNSIDQGSIYESLGFQKGDIIRSVNGEPVKNPQRALELFHDLKASSELEILVNRDGKDVNYNYNINENAPIER